MSNRRTAALSSAALEAATRPANPPPTTRTSIFAAGMAASMETPNINVSSITDTDSRSAASTSRNTRAGGAHRLPLPTRAGGHCPRPGLSSPRQVRAGAAARGYYEPRDTSHEVERDAVVPPRRVVQGARRVRHHKSSKAWETVVAVEDQQGVRHPRLHKWVQRRDEWKVDLARFSIGCRDLDSDQED